ncbi:50S ribosomal protein L24 [Moheibacter sp. BDHS18]|uniref:Large ribosomal subunit protein uL24 n=1 Tax=Moheibacter lacus TaxID=2745851 RepID=A0A838ZSW3_9FLAO|nr:50S ribosomal protein L24 [Moheibacter lacus]
MKIKKGDKVVVLSGSSKGTKGSVLKVYPEKGKAIVEGVNKIKKHTKPNAENPQGGIVETEAPIYVSKLALVDSNGKPTKVGYEVKDGKKVRIAKKTGKEI